MKQIARFLLVALCVVPFGAAHAVVSSTLGNNLTAYNGESGATNNERWNNMMNSRSGGTGSAATADFGNCNAVIMRCAQPKCSNGGCTDLNVTFSIVNGCVQSNAACKQYGDELTQYIAAQLVAQSTAKANAAANEAQNAAATAAAQQSAQQLAQMQQQMQQMQSQMAAQNAQTVAQLQSALEEQRELTANALAEASAARAAATSQPVQAATNTSALNDSQIAAAQSGVSADVLAREQISGQILSAVENAETQLKTLKATMVDAFDYAGCDSRGNNCTGPKRVKIFKQKAEAFFDPYENVLDEMYDALILAQSVGVDITDIYMMLNGSCNVWGKYLCEEGQDLRYNKTNCPNGTSDPSNSNFVIGRQKCEIGKIIPPSDGGCQPLGMINNDEEVRYNWLNPGYGEESRIRVGCMSEILDSSGLFRNRKKQATIDIETLQRIIAQDAPTSAKGTDAVKYCVGENDDLQKLTELKKLPTKKVCLTRQEWNNGVRSPLTVSGTTSSNVNNTTTSSVGNTKSSTSLFKNSGVGMNYELDEPKENMSFKIEMCNEYGSGWNFKTNTCNCAGGTDFMRCMNLTK